MSNVSPIENNTLRKALHVIDDLDMKLLDIDALLDIMAHCNHDECEVNDAAHAIQRLVGDAKKLANELYHAPPDGD